MKLEINEEEINTAIVAYVNTLGLNTDDQDVTVTIVPGRKNGNTAEIEITPKSDGNVAPEVKKTSSKKTAKDLIAEAATEEVDEIVVDDSDDDSLFSS